MNQSYSKAKKQNALKLCWDKNYIPKFQTYLNKKRTIELYGTKCMTAQAKCASISDNITYNGEQKMNLR